MSYPMHGPAVPCGSNLAFGVLGVNDDSLRELERLADEWELVRPGLPKRGVEARESALGRGSALGAPVALDCGEISLAVSVAERQAGDEPVQDDLVQHDQAWPTTKCVVDPA